MGMITKAQAELMADKAMMLDEYNPLCSTGCFSIYSGRHTDCSVEVSKGIRGWRPFFVLFVGYRDRNGNRFCWRRTDSLSKDKLVDMIMDLAFESGMSEADLASGF